MTVMPRSPSLFETLPGWQPAQPSRRSLAARTGVLPSQAIRKLVGKGIVTSGPDIEDGQIQPASLDLRLGPVAYRIRASFLPGKGRTVESKLGDLQSHAIDLTNGAVLETDCVYVVPLLESLKLRPTLSAMRLKQGSNGMPRTDAQYRSPRTRSVPGGSTT
jgi:hypothetical protein